MRLAPVEPAVAVGGRGGTISVAGSVATGGRTYSEAAAGVTGEARPEGSDSLRGGAGTRSPIWRRKTLG